MKKILLLLFLFLPLKLLAQDVIVIDPGTFGGGIINIDPWLSLDPLLDSVHNWIWVSKDNQTGRETGTYMLPYNTIPEGVADIVDGSMMIIVTPIDGSAYEITDAIIIAFDNVVITGQGSSTIIDGDGLATGEHAFSITGKTGCVIKNLSVQTEDGGGKISHCFFLDDGANNTTISNVTIIDSDSDGIHIEGTSTSGVVVSNCNIQDADGYGIYVDMDALNNMQSMQIIHNSITGAGDDGIYFGNTGSTHLYNIVQGNEVFSCGGQGIDLKEYSYGSCNDNTSVLNTSFGILMSSASGSSTIDGNVCYTNIDDGIQVNGSTDIIVSGNTCYDNTATGIEFTGNAYRCTATGNTMRTNQYGIYVESSARASITGNITEGNSASGIFIDNSPYTSVVGNVSRNDDSGEGGGGIVVMDCDLVTITGNTSSLSTYNGLYLYNASYCAVVGNIFGENTIDGIYLSDGSSYNVISNNECYTNTGDGIELAAATEIENIILSNKSSGNVESALEDNGTRTMIMHDNTATLWYFAPDIQVEDTLFLGNGEYFENETDGDIHTNANFEPETDRTYNLGDPTHYWLGVYTDDLYVSDSAHIDTVVTNYAVVDTLILVNFMVPDDSLGAYLGTEDLPFSYLWVDSIFAEHLELGTLNVDSIDADYINVDSMNANYILVDIMDADSIHVDTLDANYIYVDIMEADSIHVDTIDIDYAFADTIIVDYILVDNMDADSIRVDSIDINYADIDTMIVDYSTMNIVFIDSADVNYGDIDTLVSDYSTFNLAFIDSADINYGDIDTLISDYSTFNIMIADSADINYADIDTCVVTGLLNIEPLASPNLVVLSPDSDGNVDTTETVDIATADITVTGDWVFNNIRVDSADINYADIDTLVADYSTMNIMIIDSMDVNYGDVDTLVADYSTMNIVIADSIDVNYTDTDTLLVNNNAEVSGMLTVVGTVTGATMVCLHTAATYTFVDLDSCKNVAHFNNDADVIDFTLPGAAAGLVMMFYDIGGGVITIDPVDGTDTILLNGTSVGAGDAIDSPGAVGDFICLMAIDATRWVTVGRSGLWIDGGAD